MNSERAFFSGVGPPPPLPQQQLLPWQYFQSPVTASSSSFWQQRSEDVQQHLRKLGECIHLLKSLQKELELILLIKGEEAQSSSDKLLVQVLETINAKRISLDSQERLSVEAAMSLASSVRNQLVPLGVIASQACPWEERSLVARLSQKLHKSKRNKRWRKRKRKRVAEHVRKERENYEKADQEADEWRAREIAKDIAKRKVESMKEIAKQKANEERKRLESELELILVVEKLQELRSIRIRKLKSKGYFLPEEDDKFLERVRAAVEEEERQAAATSDTGAAKDAITTAEQSRKAIHNAQTETNEISQKAFEDSRNQDQVSEMERKISSGMNANMNSQQQQVDAQGYSVGYDSLANLPFEFFHYYHGSNNDMGTLIEVRREWDAYIRPGGSRIPGRWVQPPPPANDVWASYLLHPK